MKHGVIKFRIGQFRHTFYHKCRALKKELKVTKSFNEILFVFFHLYNIQFLMTVEPQVRVLVLRLINQLKQLVNLKSSSDRLQDRSIFQRHNK